MPVPLYLTGLVIIFAFLDLGKNISFSGSLLAELIEGFKARKDWSLFLYICPIAYSLIREEGQVFGKYTEIRGH